MSCDRPTFMVGTKVKLTGTFTVSGTATDPTSPTCKVKKPGGTVSTYTIGSGMTKRETGIYDVLVTPASGEEGVWWYRFTGVGDAYVAEEDAFEVEESEVL